MSQLCGHSAHRAGHPPIRESHEIHGDVCQLVTHPAPFLRCPCHEPSFDGALPLEDLTQLAHLSDQRQKQVARRVKPDVPIYVPLALTDSSPAPLRIHEHAA
eukprot:Polyplicarium_translucidae@DN1830_c0_g1_i4.p2